MSITFKERTFDSDIYFNDTRIGYLSNTECKHFVKLASILPNLKQDKDTIEELLSLFKMVTSVVCYATTKDVDRLSKDSYLQKYLATFTETQIGYVVFYVVSMTKAIIKDVSTDNEGLSYNSFQMVEI